MFLRLFFFIFKSNTIFNRTPFYNLKACLKRLISLHLLLEWQIKCLYVIILFAGTEKYPRGRRGGFAKALGRATGAGVRIPPSPPKTGGSNPPFSAKNLSNALFERFFHLLTTKFTTICSSYKLYKRKQYAS